jgi:flagellar biosynthetic protein FliR
MFITPWDIDYLYRAFLICLRLGALLAPIPFWGTGALPMMVKIGFVLLFTNVVALATPETPHLPSHLLGMIVAGLHEVMVGLFMGFIVRIAFQSVVMAGEIISIEGGFMRDNSFDPLSNQTGSAAEKLLSNFALVIFFSAGMHLQVFESFVKSFESIHMGVWVPSEGAMNGFISATAGIFVTAVEIAAPFLAINFVINMTFAVLGKAVPQMNVFVVSFAVLIVGGLVIMSMTLDVTAHQILQTMGQTAVNMLNMAGAR